MYAKPKIFSEWLYNLGESVIDIQVINDLVNRETWIMVLGEKNLFCLTESGTLKFMKKLDFCPICIHSYVIGNFKICTLLNQMNTAGFRLLRLLANYYISILKTSIKYFFNKK